MKDTQFRKRAMKLFSDDLFWENPETATKELVEVDQFSLGKKYKVNTENVVISI